MRIILDTDYEQNFVELWNPEKNYWERYIQCEKKETKPLNEEDKKIKRLPYYDYKETMSENNRDKFIEKLLEKHDKRLNDYHEKINEIIDYINGGTND